MPRNTRLVDPGSIDDITNLHLAVPERLNNAAPRRVSQGLE
jgi:hypothetical protein